jgi:TRAP-type C4-dicarboxylate transport system permease small subunit
MATERRAEAETAGGLVGRLGDALCRVCVVIAALSLLAIVAINVANVTGRYLFGSPFSWAEELMLFLMILIVFTATPVAAWRNQHIRIEALLDQTPATLRRWLVAIAAVISVVILSTVSVAGYQVVALLAQFDQRSDALHLPMWIPQAFLVGGLALTAAMIAVALLSRRAR